MSYRTHYVHFQFPFAIKCLGHFRLFYLVDFRSLLTQFSPKLYSFYENLEIDPIFQKNAQFFITDTFVHFIQDLWINQYFQKFNDLHVDFIQFEFDTLINLKIKNSYVFENIESTNSESTLQGHGTLRNLLYLKILEKIS